MRPDGGVLAETNMPSMPPSSIRSIVGNCEWLPEIFGMCAKP